MEYLEARENLCSQKLNIDYADVAAGNNSLFSLQDIEDAILFGISRATEYKPWPFMEGSEDITATSDESYDYSLFPESPFLVVVDDTAWAGAREGKRDFADYMKWRADYPTDDSKIWTEYGGLLYFNPNAFIAGQTFTVYGLTAFPLPSADDDPLPFALLSDADAATGDQAIIILAYANLLASEKKKNPGGAAAATKEAYGILDQLWLTVAERRAKKSPQNRPFFNSGDLFPQRRNRFDTNIGNFP